ncbi:MAG TPA: hypothetical protein VGV39_04785 [Mesorhizobium sp.]|jgi:hypothetical protein|uniref:hypothetical protein n=1 Tax=Mesorhizobium sp. TaxID=1871066 RepID=UPI002DDD576E|nr:hypothetical protein [Mesorhizobium sp.]HEV2502365.1 hypothetical protein [Mesorhizobium sp.]
MSSHDQDPRVEAAIARGSQHVEIAHDGFAGDIIGHYVTREGKRGVVVQQDGTRVVHVYGEKWLSPAALRDGDQIAEMVSALKAALPHVERLASFNPTTVENTMRTRQARNDRDIIVAAIAKAEASGHV